MKSKRDYNKPMEYKCLSCNTIITLNHRICGCSRKCSNCNSTYIWRIVGELGV